MEAIMEEFSAEYFKKLAHDIMFDLNDEEVSELQEEFKVLLQQIELLDGIDTEGVEEMIYPFEAETTFLREDSVDNVISQEAALRLCTFFFLRLLLLFHRLRLIPVHIFLIGQRIIACLTVINDQNRGCQLTDKIAVMGNKQHRSLIILQRLLQCFFSDEVQMIGRLIH